MEVEFTFDYSRRWRIWTGEQRRSKKYRYVMTMPRYLYNLYKGAPNRKSKPTEMRRSLWVQKIHRDIIRRVDPEKSPYEVCILFQEMRYPRLERSARLSGRWGKS